MRDIIATGNIQNGGTQMTSEEIDRYRQLIKDEGASDNENDNCDVILSPEMIVFNVQENA